MAGKGAVFISILGDSTGLTAATTKAQASLAGLDAKAKSAGLASTGFGKVSTVAFLAAGAAVVGFAVASIHAYEEHQKALVNLQSAIKGTPPVVAATTKAFVDQAMALQNLTGANHDEILAADATLSRVGLTRTQVMAMTQSLIGAAHAMGTDLPTAAALVGRAFLGNARGMKSLGIEFTATGNRAKDFATIMADLKSRHLDQLAVLFGQSLPGKIAIFQGALHNLEEAAGQQLLPVVSGLVGALTALVRVLGPLAKNLPLILASFAGFAAIRYLPALLGAISTGLLDVAVATNSSAILGAAAGMEGLGVAAGAAVLPITLAAGALVLIGFALSKVNKNSLLAAQNFKSVGNGAIGVGRVWQSNVQGMTDSQKRFNYQLALSHDAIDTLSSGVGHLDPVMASLAAVTGQTASTFQTQMDTALQDGQKAFQAFANSAVASFVKWRDGLVTNLDGADSALQGLESTAHLTASKLIATLKATGAAQSKFSREWVQGMNQAGQRGKAFFSFIAQQGLQALPILNAYTNANAKQKKVILDSYNAQQKGATSLANVVSTKLVGAINTLNRVLIAIAKKWGVTINLATGGAQSKIDSVLAGLQNMTNHQWIVNVQYHSRGMTPTITTHAGGGVASGLSWVGERGPELVNFTSPTRVYTHQQSMAMASGGGDTYNVYLTVEGSVVRENELIDAVQRGLIQKGRRNGGAQRLGLS